MIKILRFQKNNMNIKGSHNSADLICDHKKPNFSKGKKFLSIFAQSSQTFTCYCCWHEARRNEACSMKGQLSFAKPDLHNNWQSANRRKQTTTWRLSICNRKRSRIQLGFPLPHRIAVNHSYSFARHNNAKLSFRNMTKVFPVMTSFSPTSKFKTIFYIGDERDAIRSCN